MVNIIKEEISLEESLKKKIEFICEFAKVQPTIINGSIRKIDKTNLTYIEPHRIIINNITFLAFNYSNEIFIANLSNKIKLSELENYIKSINDKQYPSFIRKRGTSMVKCTINKKYNMKLRGVKGISLN